MVVVRHPSSGIFTVLEIGALCGVPMAPRQIEELIQTLNRTNQEHVVRNENDEGKER